MSPILLLRLPLPHISASANARRDRHSGAPSCPCTRACASATSSSGTSTIHVVCTPTRLHVWRAAPNASPAHAHTTPDASRASPKHVRPAATADAAALLPRPSASRTASPSCAYAGSCHACASSRSSRSSGRDPGVRPGTKGKASSVQDRMISDRLTLGACYRTC